MRIMSKEKRVLMICDTFPPESDVGGLRPAMLSKYLPYSGWEPVILTRVRPSDDPLYQPILNVNGLPNESRVFSVVFGTKDEDLMFKRRSLCAKLKHVFHPEESHPLGLYERMWVASQDMIKTAKFDAIWATSPPLYPLRVARELSKIDGIPWVADLRDIAEQESGRNDCLGSRFLRFRTVLRRNQILRTASAVVGVSSFHSETLGRAIGREVHTIPNGFDPEMFCSHKPHTSKYFSIVYMGRIIGSWLQDPRLLFEALDRLVENPDVDEGNIDVCFYGTEPAILKDLLLQYKCHRLVRVEHRVSYNEVPKILCNSLILLILTNRERRGILTTKVFEYLAARRPILCVPGDGGELDALLKSTNAGVSCSSVKSTVKTLRAWYRKWLATGTVEYHGRDDEILKYSRIKQAGELANVLNRVTCGRK